MTDATALSRRGSSPDSLSGSGRALAPRRSPTRDHGNDRPRTVGEARRSGAACRSLRTSLLRTARPERQRNEAADPRIVRNHRAGEHPAASRCRRRFGRRSQSSLHGVRQRIQQSSPEILVAEGHRVPDVLDVELVRHVIERTSEVDRDVAAMLADHANQFAFTPLLRALRACEAKEVF